MLEGRRQTRSDMRHRQGRQQQGIDEHEARLMNRRHQILAHTRVHPDCSADAAVHHRQKRGRHMNERHAPQVGRRHEAGRVAHYTPAEPDHYRIAPEPCPQQAVGHLHPGLACLVPLAGGKPEGHCRETFSAQRRVQPLAIDTIDLAVGDDSVARSPAGVADQGASVIQKPGTHPDIVG